MTPTVLKVGGSQSRHDELPALCAALAKAGERHPLLVVPGGGDFANGVRRCADRYPLSDTAAHWMAILAMDQYGLLLCDMISKSRPVRSLDEAVSVVDEGRVAVLLPHDWLRREDPLPHSWDVTSDAIAAWVAGRAGSERLVLVKDVDGLYDAVPDAPDARLIGEMDISDLPDNGGVDTYLAQALKEAACETWVVNGRFPERVAQLLETGAAPGTRVRRG
ncbi:MAG: hypothetical protein AB7E51_17875 [Pseudodesulfovibrio sp.]|jgi:aspartokinase-like uncharacterized kinase|uniref:amino acid kinase family protein n=1 Tax=Pseudodesulfovibrio sp. TaxID=2035812 RepID=UPI003D0CCBB9